MNIQYNIIVFTLTKCMLHLDLLSYFSPLPQTPSPLLQTYICMLEKIMTRLEDPKYAVGDLQQRLTLKTNRTFTWTFKSISEESLLTTTVKWSFQVCTCCVQWTWIIISTFINICQMKKTKCAHILVRNTPFQLHRAKRTIF